DKPDYPDNPDNRDHPDNPSVNTVLEELQEALIEASTYSGDGYTASSWQALKDAIAAARKVWKDADATEMQLKRALNSLYAAIDGLKEETGTETDGSVKKHELSAAIQAAASLNSSSYSAKSWLQLTVALGTARGVYSDAEATQSEVDRAANDLKLAVLSLEAAGSGSGDSGSSSDDKTGSDEDDGYYEVNVRLWHATMNKASMGDPAIVRKAYVHIDDGDITMRLSTKKMTTSGITTHLYEFYIYDSGDYEEAELISTENSRWVYEFELPNDSSTYYKCKVDPRVDVMGDDPVKARLKVDWKSLDEVDEDDWDDLEGDTDDDDDDDSSSSSSSGTGSTTELVSAETGIRAKGKLNGPGYVLEASRLTNGSQYELAANQLAEADVNRYVVYDIKLRSGSSYLQPSGSLTVSIPIPSGYDTDKLILYRINDDGTRNEITGRVNGSYYEASVDHFSLYCLAESNKVTAAAAKTTSAETSAKTSGSGSSTKTAAAASSGSSTGSSVSKTSSASSKTMGTAGTVKKTSASAILAESAEKSAGSNKAAAAVSLNRDIPYTGDRMPVAELSVIGALAALAFLGILLEERKERRKQTGRQA
ncbi:MAG: NEAT domain-containing protein, partial [Eubacteriales bacterium]|nr:NEAT domain-containing protein [Eubacteriales bacterium]